MKTLLLLTVIAALLSGCSTTEFQSWEGTNSIMQGQGGTREVVDGMDIWTRGNPPRTFQVLGIIEDNRGGGLIPMARFKHDIVQKARERGGDAVIWGSFSSQTAFYQTNFHGDSATTIPYKTHSSTFVVIKYLG